MQHDLLVLLFIFHFLPLYCKFQEDDVPVYFHVMQNGILSTNSIQRPFLDRKGRKNQYSGDQTPTAAGVGPESLCLVIVFLFSSYC